MRLSKWTKRLVEALEVPAPDPLHMVHRIQAMERDIVLPVKVAVLAVLIYNFYFSVWVDVAQDTREVAVEAVELFFRVYLLVNIAVAWMLVSIRRMPLGVIQWVVFFTCLVDCLFLAAMTLITGGFDSLLYWIYLGLVVRNAISVPASASQLVLHFCTILSFVFAGVLDLVIAEEMEASYDLTTRRALDVGIPENPAEPFLLRLIMLVLLSISCYGLQVLVEKEREAAEEAREFAVRQEQLRSAGRVAAEIAHQIKNPLGIINNAAWSLRRALQEQRGDPGQQVQIIQEEIERSDRILNRLIGYGKLAEVSVEKLNVNAELDRAIQEVFPPAAQFDVQVHRDQAAHLPALMMQRDHLAEIFVNLLQNAREALRGRGNVWIETRYHDHYSVEVSIRDDGPGIPADKHEKIFDAYYSEKEKGTGLGLAIVKHNIELYGGSVRVESELGKGARFILLFPAKALIKPAK